MKKEYVLGFAFSPDNEFVLLINKLKPEWQKGKLNGIGGKIEEGELPIQAMVREFEEETSVKTSFHNWDRFAMLEGDNYVMYCYRINIYDIEEAVTSEEEEVVKMRYHVAILSPILMDSLRVLLPMAYDTNFKFSSIKHRGKD